MRIARIAVPDIPYHVTQRGNHRQRVFFHDSDYSVYLQLLLKNCTRYQLEVWAYCLMPNHVHLIVVPRAEKALSRAIAETHRLYSRHVHFREGWRGFLWQGRFASFPMDENYLLAAVRYVERNPVAAGMVRYPENYPWSSARARILGLPDPILADCFLPHKILNWQEFLCDTGTDSEARIRRHTNTGRPLGSEKFVDRLELVLGRPLRRRKRGFRKGSRPLLS